MWELKTHEIIENVFIMARLQERLRARRVADARVCNCHEDSGLRGILDLVEALHRLDAAATSGPAVVNWQRLQAAVVAFMDEFVGHMEEEETTFQPLLCQYFDYEELKQIRTTVLDQHKLWKEKVIKEKNLNNLPPTKEQETEFIQPQRSSSYCDSLRHLADKEEMKKVAAAKQVPSLLSLPDEMLLRVLAYLGPQDLAAGAGAACRRLRQVSQSRELWRRLPLSQWEAGNWSWIIDSDAPSPPQQLTFDEDLKNPEFYSQFSQFCASIGSHVRELSVRGSRGIDNLRLNSILEHCVNLETLDVGDTGISDNGLQLAVSGELTSLRHLDVSGCRAVTDLSLRRMAGADNAAGGGNNSGLCLQSLRVSGCTELTDRGILALYPVNGRLERADFSGCWRLSGRVLAAFAANCPRLRGDDLAYCNLIEDGPFPQEALGCQSDACQEFCCQSQSFA